MTKKQILLVQLAEELGEVQHVIHKALRFGLDDTNPKTGETNASAICRELTDVTAVIHSLRNADVWIEPYSTASDYYQEKMQRIEAYLEYSKERQVLKDDSKRKTRHPY